MSRGKVSQEVGRDGQGSNAGQLQDLFDGDDAASLHLGRVGMLLVILLGVDAEIKDWVCVVISVSTFP